MNDAYATLGVARTASEDEIKKAFRSLAMKHHPDRGGDAEAFKRCSEAYALIGTPDKRASYDMRFGGPTQSTYRHAQEPFVRWDMNPMRDDDFFTKKWQSMMDDPKMQEAFREATDRIFDDLIKEWQTQRTNTQESMRQQKPQSAREEIINQQKQRARDMWETHRRNHYGV